MNRRFNNLKRSVHEACIEGGILPSSERYLLNKISRIIKRAHYDIYEVYVSPIGYETGGYYHCEKFDSIDGSLYVSLRVD